VTISRERVVPLPVEEVWRRTEDLDELSDWFEGGDRFELLDGSGRGRRQRMHGRWGKKRAEIDQVVSAYDPPHRIVWEHEAERLDGKPAPRFARSTVFEIRLIPRPEGCLVRLRSTQEPAGLFKGLGLRLFAKRELASRFERSLMNLPGKAPVSPGP
jgi:uncharacterized protein YndB with AHSA1/START domain